MVHLSSVLNVFRQNFNKSQQYGNRPAGEVERALSVHMDTLRTQRRSRISGRGLDGHVQVKKKAVRLSRLKSVSW